MAAQSLEARITQAGSAYEMLYDNVGTAVAFPIAAEFSNWRDEQLAWRKTAIFQDMSFHMCNLHIEGPDTYKLLSDLGINSFASFGPMQAKQYVACNDEGFYLGDAILTCERENEVRLVGKTTLPNWIRFNIERGKYDVRVVNFDRPSPNLKDRALFRFQIQGPQAQAILEETNGGALPEIGFFKMGRFKVGPHEVTALNHRMSGAAGFEIWGPPDIGGDVKSHILAAGEKLGLRQIGGRVFRVTATESGWVSAAIPALYTGSSTKQFREWLPAEGYEATASIGGSFPRGNLEELYLTPYEMGYGFMAKFDHEFVGRAALEKISKQRHRKKVRLVWDADDVTKVQRSLYGQGPYFKYMEIPVADYATFQADEVLADNMRIGFTFHPVYSMEARAWISLAIIDAAYAEAGRDAVVTWGERDGGSKKLSVERHEQTTIGVTVEPNAIRRD